MRPRFFGAFSADVPETLASGAAVTPVFLAAFFLPRVPDFFSVTSVTSMISALAAFFLPPLGGVYLKYMVDSPGIVSEME